MESEPANAEKEKKVVKRIVYDTKPEVKKVLPSPIKTDDQTGQEQQNATLYPIYKRTFTM